MCSQLLEWLCLGERAGSYMWLEKWRSIRYTLPTCTLVGAKRERNHNCNVSLSDFLGLQEARGLRLRRGTPDGLRRMFNNHLIELTAWGAKMGFDHKHQVLGHVRVVQVLQDLLADISGGLFGHLLVFE